MDKIMYDTLKQYETEINKAYMALSANDELGTERLHELFKEFDVLHDYTFQTGEFIDEDNYIGKYATIKKTYEDVPAHLKLKVYYEFENGYSLCESSVDAHYLIPSDLLTYL